VSLSASDYVDFTRIMALYKLYYLLTYLLQAQYSALVSGQRVVPKVFMTSYRRVIVYTCIFSTIYTLRIVLRPICLDFTKSKFDFVK